VLGVSETVQSSVSEDRQIELYRLPDIRIQQVCHLFDFMCNRQIRFVKIRIETIQNHIDMWTSTVSVGQTLSCLMTVSTGSLPHLMFTLFSIVGIHRGWPGWVDLDIPVRDGLPFHNLQQSSQPVHCHAWFEQWLWTSFYTITINKYPELLKLIDLIVSDCRLFFGIIAWNLNQTNYATPWSITVFLLCQSPSPLTQWKAQ